MSEITRAYQLRIYDTAGSSVETTFDSTDIEGLPSFGWTTPRPLEGRIENVPSVVTVADIGEQVTAILSGADGRADLIGRLADIRINESGAGYAVVHAGRITEIRLNEEVAGFNFHIADERWLEKGATVLTSGSTTQILPSGTVSAFKDFGAAPTMRLQVVRVPSADRLVLSPVDSVIVSRSVVEWLENDLTFEISWITGNTPFGYTKLRASAGDRDILSFTRETLGPVLGNLQEQSQDGEPRELQYIYVKWTSHGYSVGNEISGCYIYAPNAPPSEWTPIHVGGESGVDFFSWVKDQYDTLGINYENPGAFSTYNASTNPNGLLSHPRIPKIHIRATEPVNLGEMVEKGCKMLAIVPFVNSAGEVAPRFVTNLQDVNPATFTEITASIATDPHPTWSQTSGEIVTVIQSRYTNMIPADDEQVRTGNDVPVDRIVAEEHPLVEWEHDRVSQLGRHELELDMTLITDGMAAYRLLFQQGREIFDRFGDGPITGSVRAMSGAKTVEPGDYVKLTLSSFPNVGIQARGGTRIVQIMSREVESGYTFTYLDAGPNSVALSAPGCAIAKNGTDGKHAVDVTISSLTAGSAYEIQLKVGAGGDWTTYGVGTANETVTFGNLPSGTTIYARALETAPGRIKSAYSSAVNVTLDSLTAPSVATVDQIAGDRARGKWTNGETDYDIEVLLDGTRLAILEAGSTRYYLTGLTPSTTYNSPGFQVRHIDRFGGVSAASTDTFSTTGTATTLTQPFATRVLVGGDAA